MKRLLTAVILALSACVASSCGADDRAGDAGARVESAARGAWSPEGAWSGWLSCAGRDFPFTLEIGAPDGAAATAALTVAPALNKSNYLSPWGQSVEGLAMTGSWLGDARILKLVDAAGGPRAISATLLFDPARNEALMATSRCDGAVLGRGDAAEAIATTLDELVLLQDRPAITVEDQKGACPAHLERWVEKGLALPLDDWARGDASALWTDETFVEIFGKTSAELSAAKRQEAYLALVGRCGVAGDRRRNAVTRLLSGVTNYRSFTSQRMAAHRRDVITAWTADADAALEASRPLSTSVLTAMRGAQHNFSFETAFADGAFDKSDYDVKFASAVEASQARDRAAAFVQNMDRAADNFPRLVGLYGLARANDDIDLTEAEAAFQRLLPLAAESFASAAATVAEGKLMAEWVIKAGDEDGECARVKAACRRAAQTFERRVSALSKEFAAAEKARLDEAKREDRSLQLLERAVAHDLEMPWRYGPVLEQNAFKPVLKDRAKWRRTLQNKLRADILAQVDAAMTAPEIRSLRTTYYYADDLEEAGAKRVRRAMEAVLAASEPFDGTEADDYLNAIYNRDYAALRQLDNEALAQLRPAFGFLARHPALWRARRRVDAKPPKPVSDRGERTGEPLRRQGGRGRLSDGLSGQV